MSVLSPTLTVGAAVGLLVLLGGCGGGGDVSPPAGSADAKSGRGAPTALEPLRACPSRSWANGGGENYRVAGAVTCGEVNELMLESKLAPDGGAYDRGFTSGDWVCVQRQVGAPVRTICADGKSRFSLLFY
jgi:hypothetical protein